MNLDQVLVFGSMKYAFGFSLIVLILVALNNLFYTLNTVGKTGAVYSVPREPDLKSNVYKEIYEYLNYLPNQYKSRNTNFVPIQRNLIQLFDPSSSHNINDVWQYTDDWISEESLFPQNNGTIGKILHDIRTAEISKVDIAPKGSQLKLLLILDGKNKMYFKPKRYELTDIITGDIYGGYDRHNSEVFAYYLAMVMNFKWIAPCVIRKIHVTKELLPVATNELRFTMIKKGTSRCIYGKCKPCNFSKTICSDKNGEIEGATILHFNTKFWNPASPWRRSYNKSSKMSWEIENNYCVKVMSNLTLKRILNLVDVSLFDFLIQNGDRHHYQLYKDKIMLLDNGKGLGNPMVDELDILAPLYQCCMMTYSTWQHLEMLSGGILTETIKILSSFQGYKLATEEHYKAVERRLLKIYAAVQYCIGKHGHAKVFKLS